MGLRSSASHRRSKFKQISQCDNPSETCLHWTHLGIGGNASPLNAATNTSSRIPNLHILSKNLDFLRMRVYTFVALHSSRILVLKQACGRHRLDCPHSRAYGFSSSTFRRPALAYAQRQKQAGKFPACFFIFSGLDKNVCSMAGDGSQSESSTNETREASDCLFSLPKGYKKDLLIHDRRRGILAQ